MKKTYLKPYFIASPYEEDVIMTSSIATQGEKDPYGNDKDWGAII